MPRTPKVCSTPGCPNLTDGDPRCATHTPQPWAGSTRRERVGTSGWQQQRDARRIMIRHRGICHVCGHPGADQVDHVIALAAGGTDTDTNKRPIHANPCHREKTEREAAAARRRVG